MQKNHTIQKWFHSYQNLGYLVIRLICANTLSSGSRSERQTKSAEISFLQNCLNIAQSAKNEGAKITKKLYIYHQLQIQRILQLLLHVFSSP